MSNNGSPHGHRLRISRYAAEAVFAKRVGDQWVRFTPPPTTPYVAVDSFDGMRMGVEKILETYGDQEQLVEVRLIRLGMVAGGDDGRTTQDDRPPEGSTFGVALRGGLDPGVGD